VEALLGLGYPGIALRVPGLNQVLPDERPMLAVDFVLASWAAAFELEIQDRHHVDLVGLTGAGHTDNGAPIQLPPTVCRDF
jgi:hypothetical protein